MHDDPDKLRTAAGRRRLSRGAFTLIELLVVIGILVGLMAIAVGAWAGLQEPSAEIAARELIGDLVRQARQQSLSTGRPTVITIDGDTGTVGGINQIPVWTEDFQWDDPAPPDRVDEDPPGLHSVGSAGYGWNAIEGRRLAAVELAEPDLIRSATDGLFMELDVRPQAIHESPLLIQPLLLLTAGSDDDVGNRDVIAGLELWRLPLLSFWPDHATSTDDETYYQWTYLQQDHWMLVGWVGERPTDRYQFESDDFPLSQPVDYLQQRSRRGRFQQLIPTLNQTDIDAGIRTDTWVRDYVMTSPSAIVDSDWIPPGDDGIEVAINQTTISGGSWMRVGLLFDGSSLHLLRDGSIIDSARLPLAADGSDPTAADAPLSRERMQQRFGDLRNDPVQLWIARHKEAGAATTEAIALIDQITVDRIAVSDPAALPDGIQTPLLPDTEDLRTRYRLVAANGSLRLFSDHPDIPPDVLRLVRSGDAATLEFKLEASGVLRPQY